jgi:hypothetical protein
MGTTARALIEGFAGGIRDGKQLKAFTPGGSSTPFLTADHLDVQMGFDEVQAAGSLLGTKAMIVLDEGDCVVEAVRRFTQFYAHESCGKCTPCREGTWWLSRVLGRLEQGSGREEDIDLIHEVGQNMLFKSFCALADGAVSPIDSSIKYFRHEYEEHVRLGRCPLKEAGRSWPPPGALGWHHGADRQVVPRTGDRARRGAVVSASTRRRRDRHAHDRREGGHGPQGNADHPGGRAAGRGDPAVLRSPLLDPVAACRQCYVKVEGSGSS